MAVGTLKAVIGCRRRQRDGYVLRLLFPLLFDFNRREEHRRLGDGRGGPVRLLGLRQRSDGDRRRGGRRVVTVSLGVLGFVVEAV